MLKADASLAAKGHVITDRGRGDRHYRQLLLEASRPSSLRVIAVCAYTYSEVTACQYLRTAPKLIFSTHRAFGFTLLSYNSYQRNIKHLYPLVSKLYCFAFRREYRYIRQQFLFGSVGTKDSSVSQNSLAELAATEKIYFNKLRTNYGLLQQSVAVAVQNTMCILFWLQCCWCLPTGMRLQNEEILIGFGLKQECLSANGGP